MKQAQDYFNALNRDYLNVHQNKENLFWQNYMGTGDENVSDAFSAAETAYKRFIAEPSRPQEIRDAIASLEKHSASDERDALLHGLRGWLNFFDCNVIEDPKAQALMDEIIQAESVLFGKRKQYRMTHINSKGERVSASLGELLTNQANNENEAYRRSSQNALRDLEDWLLHNGLPELIGLRNRFPASSVTVTISTIK